MSSLTTSIPDTIALGQAVEERFISLLDDYLRIRGVHLLPPTCIEKDLSLWRSMRIRHRRGDFRNTEEEEKAVKVVASWTLDINCELRNQPRKKLDWEE